MTAYYNENDPYVAQWLRNLIAAGHIAPGDVDERDIRDVKPLDLLGYDQCHFFAGIGGWSRALRLVGWPDDREVWTGSCPCQPFSAAGGRVGFADERHLWPAFFHLIEIARPRVVFGEQVASEDGLAWLDLVQVDLEAANYAVGAVDLCATGIGAPHIRQRLWFVADADGRNTEAERLQRSGEQRQLAQNRRDGWMAEPDAGGRAPRSVQGHNEAHEGGQAWSAVIGLREPCELGDANKQRLQGRSLSAADCGRDGAGECVARTPSAVNGFWVDADWLPCTDGKARPVEPGTFPLAHGAPARVGRLRAYGNAIVPQVAVEFIKATGLMCAPS